MSIMRVVRQAKGLTLDALAEQTGVSEAFLSLIETEARTPSLKVALKIARALNVRVEDLFGNEEKNE